MIPSSVWTIDCIFRVFSAPLTKCSIDMEKGAIRLVPKGQGDGSNDFDNQFHDWQNLLWPNVIESFGLKMNDYSVRTVIHFSVEFVSGLIRSPLNEVHSFPSTIIENHELHGEDSIHHIEIALPEGVTYHEGDYIGILTLNSLSLVDQSGNKGCSGKLLSENYFLPRFLKENTKRRGLEISPFRLLLNITIYIFPMMCCTVLGPH
jgi:hypothetical protein